MKIKTDYVPEEVDYLTAGKEYEANQSEEYNWCYTITTNSGEEELVCLSSCAHLNGRHWKIVQDEPQFSQEQAREMYEKIEGLLDILSEIRNDPEVLNVWRCHFDQGDIDAAERVLAKARGESN